jgi:hypothetical protein
MMKNIYNKAAGVLIWLGESRAASNAYPIISNISERFCEDTGLQISEIIGSGGLTLTSEDLDLLEEFTTVNVADKTPMEAYEDLADFFSLPWFRRVWVPQEVFSDTIVIARVGRLSFPGTSIILAAIWQSVFDRSHTTNSELFARATARQGTDCLAELWLGLVHNHLPRGLSMVELVCRVRVFQASDPRDKVFGQLSLANDMNSKTEFPNLRPDYTKSKVEVYSGFARDIICKTGTLESEEPLCNWAACEAVSYSDKRAQFLSDTPGLRPPGRALLIYSTTLVLSAADTFTSESRPTECPSRMPNLDIYIATIRGLSFPPKYHAGFSTKVSTSPSRGIRPDPNVLSLRGFILDTFSAYISPLLLIHRDLQLYIGSSPHAISTLWNDYVHPYSDCNIDATLESFIRTLTATGIALTAQFTAHTLGKVVPTHTISSLKSGFAAHMQKTQTQNLHNSKTLPHSPTRKDSRPSLPRATQTSSPS